MADYPSFISFGIASFQLKRKPDQLTASVCALEADPAADSPEVLAADLPMTPADHTAAACMSDPEALLTADSSEIPAADSPEIPTADSPEASATSLPNPPAADSPEALTMDPAVNQTADWEADQLSTFISDDALPTYEAAEAASQAQSFPGFNRPVPPIFRMAQVRFLNASTNPFSVDVLVDGSVYLRNSSFGSVSQYSPISDGFHTVTVRRSSSIRTIVFQGVFPFVSGQKTTLSIADSPSGAITIFQLSDTGCFSCPNRCGCYRVANMTFPGSSFDIQTPAGDRVFRNISFGQASPYRQASAGFYRFFVTEPSGFQPVRELPILLQTFLTGSFTPPSSLASISVHIEAGKTYTTYLIGNTWSAFRLQALTVED